MTFSEVKIQRFQSIWDLDLALGDLTVIVGPSNSGKSAFGRALRAVCRNVNSPGVVSSGATTATVVLKTDDGKAVSLERGKGASTYRLVEGGREERYGKAGRDVPQDIQDVLKVWECDPELHFATQFDPPYLLANTATTASKVLGELTNVTMLAEAAREANRRRQESQRRITFVHGEVKRALQELKDRHSDLPKKVEVCKAMRETMDANLEDSGKLDRLVDASQKVKYASMVASQVRGQVARSTEHLEAVTRYLEDVTGAAEQYQALMKLVESIKYAHVVGEQARDAAREQHEQVEKWTEKVADALNQEGVCPLCGTALAA